jgi:hypothetical protein
MRTRSPAESNNSQSFEELISKPVFLFFSLYRIFDFLPLKHQPLTTQFKLENICFENQEKKRETKKLVNLKNTQNKTPLIKIVYPRKKIKILNLPKKTNLK